MNRKRIIVQLISLSSFLAACISAQPIPTATLPPTPIPLKSTPISATNTLIPPSPTPASTATESLSEFPTGSFQNASLAATIVLNEDGTWTFLVQGDAFLLGDYTVEGDLVTLSDVSARCSGLGNGIYFWRFEEDVLYLKTSEDGCDLRRSRLTMANGYKLQK